jgi:precorrin-2 dehydrogenase/sirohydrochlorin ferrochelatase
VNLLKVNYLASDNDFATTARVIQPPGYTIELDLQNQLVVIVGAGRIAMRKIPDLIASGARINLIDPAPLTELPATLQLKHHKRPYRITDLNSARLVFAATNEPPINSRVAKDARTLGILCCRVDSSADSDFMSPARLQRPPLSFSISTGGESPAMAAVLRDLLAEKIPAVWQTATELAAAIRRKVLTDPLQIPYNQQVLLHLIEQGLFECLEQSDVAGIDRLLLEHFGENFSLKNLQFSLPEGTP